MEIALKKKNWFSLLSELHEKELKQQQQLQSIVTLKSTQHKHLHKGDYFAIIIPSFLHLYC